MNISTCEKCGYQQPNENIQMPVFQEMTATDRRKLELWPELIIALGRLINDSMFRDHPESSQMAIDVHVKATSIEKEPK